MKRIVLLVVVALALGSCRLLIGPLEECTLTADCASRGAALVCDRGLCVASGVDAGTLDPRCVRFGGGTQDLIRLGSILPFTQADGGPNPTGVFRRHAMELAVDQVNPGVRVGIHGRAIELLECDTQGDATAPADLAAHLIDQQRVVGLLSSTSADTLAVARISIDRGVLLMSVSATSPEITNLPDHGLVWRTATPDTFQAYVIASYLKAQSTPAPMVAVLQQDDAYGQGLAGAFLARYPSDRAVTFIFEKGGTLDTAVAQAVATGPQVLLIIAFPNDAVRLLTRLKAEPSLAGVRFFFTDSARSPVLLDSALPSVMGTSPAPADRQSETYRWFDTNYRQHYGADPATVSFTANSFDAAMLLSLAAYSATRPGLTLSGASLAQGLTVLADLDGGVPAPLSPPRFIDAVNALEQGRTLNVEGASGPLDFDVNTGEAPPTAVEVWRTDGGAFETLQVVNP